MYNSLLFCFCLIFSGLVSAQSYSVEWFEQSRIEAESAITRYKVGPNNLIYAVSLYPSMIGGFKSEFSFKKFDAKLNLLEEVEIDLSEYEKGTNLIAYEFVSEGLAIFGYSFDDNTDEVRFFRTVLSLDNLAPLEPFREVHKVSNVSWDSRRPAYPLSSKQSSDKQFIIVTLFPSQIPSGKGISFILNLNGDVVFDPTPPEEGMFLGAIENGSLLHFMENPSEGKIQRHTTVNVITGETRMHDLSLDDANYRFVNDHIGQVYSYAFDKNESKFSLEIFCPSAMDSPIKVMIPDDKLSWIADKRQRKSTLWPLVYQKILDVHQNDDGTFILTSEYCRDIPDTNSTYETENVVSICFDHAGTIIWMQCIPRHQYSSSLRRQSTVSFRTEEGLHLLYNDGTNNLTITPEDRPISYGNMGAGEDIITIATVSNDGNLTREAFYTNTGDKMWLNIWDSGIISDDLIILSLDFKRNQRFGIIKLD